MTGVAHRPRAPARVNPAETAIRHVPRTLRRVQLSSSAISAEAYLVSAYEYGKMVVTCFDIVEGRGPYGAWSAGGRVRLPSRPAMRFAGDTQGA